MGAIDWILLPHFASSADKVLNEELGLKLLEKEELCYRHAETMQKVIKGVIRISNKDSLSHYHILLERLYS